MRRSPLPTFEMRHRMALALEYGSVTVSEMADELGVSRTTISNYLHGRTQPQRGHLIVWAMRCGVPFDWLVQGGDLDEPAASQPPAKPASKPVKKSRKASA